MVIDGDDRGRRHARAGCCQQFRIGNVTVKNRMAVGPPCCTRVGSMSKAKKSTPLDFSNTAMVWPTRP
ncbi:MAG: hypothetical protein IPK39_23485 [Sulfuritalea sp.]|nr:hypothetical protein [Sulfuritalea sp.]